MGYEDDDLKPYLEPPKDMRDEKRVLKLQNIGYTLQQITEALDRERFEEIHATYLLLKEKKSNEADTNGISIGNVVGGDLGKSVAQTGGTDANSLQYPRSLSAQVTTSKNNRRSSHDQQQSGVPTTQSSNVTQQPILEGGKPNSLFYVPNLGNSSSKSGASRASNVPATSNNISGIAPNSPASVAFRQVPFNSRQPALSVQPTTGGKFFFKRFKILSKKLEKS